MADKNQGVREILRGTKKRRIMTQELMGKFSSKADFIKYFSESRKVNVMCSNFLCSLAVCTAGQNGEQGLPQAGVHWIEETA